MIPCRGCQEPIEFVQLKSGKRHPVDVDSLQSYTLSPGVVVVTEEGEILWGSEATANVTVRGYASHFASCPHSNDFRKK